jgi:hypothetical protein
LAAGMSPENSSQWAPSENGNGNGNGVAGGYGASGYGYGHGGAWQQPPVEKQGSSTAPAEMSSAGMLSEMSATREDERSRDGGGFVAELPGAEEMVRRR